MIERAGTASKEDDVGAREGIPSYVAHSAEDGRLEPLEAHLREVSEMAARFAEPLGMAELAADVGLMHDLGKYSDAFQDRVLRGGPKVDHSTAGAWELSSRGSWEGAYLRERPRNRGPSRVAETRRMLTKGLLRACPVSLFASSEWPRGGAWRIGGLWASAYQAFCGNGPAIGGGGRRLPTQTSQIVTQTRRCGAAGGLAAGRAQRTSVLCGRGGC